MIKKREREHIITEINITPLTDVMMVLLVIFMVTTPFIMQGSIKINLPAANAPADETPDKDIIVGITDAGKVYLNGAEIPGEQALLAGIKALAEKSSSKRVIIEGDKNAAHGTVVKVMGIAREAGAEKLAVSTIPEQGKFKVEEK
jgi:biopolymer transport protein ExbD